MRFRLSRRTGIGVAMVLAALLLATAWPGCITCKDAAARDRCEAKCREDCEFARPRRDNDKDKKHSHDDERDNSRAVAQCKSDCPLNCLPSCWGW